MFHSKSSVDRVIAVAAVAAFVAAAVGVAALYVPRARSVTPRAAETPCAPAPVPVCSEGVSLSARR
jgi:hypothetical protein